MKIKDMKAKIRELQEEIERTEKAARRPRMIKGGAKHKEAINAFTPEAEKYAELHSGQPGGFSRAFCDKMNDLTIAAGLRVDMDTLKRAFGKTS